MPKYLLDLFLTNFGGNHKTIVFSNISDHKCVDMSIGIELYQSEITQRRSWNFGATNWKLMFAKISAGNWRILEKWMLQQVLRGSLRVYVHYG